MNKAILFPLYRSLAPFLPTYPPLLLRRAIASFLLWDAGQNIDWGGKGGRRRAPNVTTSPSILRIPRRHAPTGRR